MNVTVERKQTMIPSYVPGPPNDLPFFLEKKPYQGATGRIYPVPFIDRISNELQEKSYDLIKLENDFIEVELLPELGGKVHGARDKSNGYEFIYKNTVIKPAMVGIAGPWVSGGIEFNWPQHHRPTTFLPLEATIQKNSGGSVTCWMGEAEPFNRMRGTVGITLYPDRSYVEARVIVTNRSDRPLPFMWWNNLAVRVHSQYKATFPPDVEFGNDHDRRAVITFPVMKGVYHSARPFDYGDGVDATWYSNIKLPTSVMVMRGQSKMDFLGGYDFAAGAGTVTVADHHISVGKKMWTWGDGPFGHSWCANLTDNGDRYIELMTGVYTDNQPDFTYIWPGETKEFSQVWFPIKGIGEASNASLEGAVSLHEDGGLLRIGAMTTCVREKALVRLRRGEELLLQRRVDLEPSAFFLETVPKPAGMELHELCLELLSKSGECLVSYTPPVYGQKEPPKAREIPPQPENVESLEELYLHGSHLEQYKHHTYDPAAYYREALRRDPEDYRCNLAMGRLCTEKGDFKTAETYLRRAVQRIRMRNDNPADTEAIYMLARLKRLQGDDAQALELYNEAAWQYQWRSPCYYEIACIQCKRGMRDKAAASLRLALETNVKFFATRNLLAYLTRDTKALERVLEESPQDSTARFALYLLSGRPMEDYLLSRPEDMLDIALEFKRAGLTEEALTALRLCRAQNQLLACHIAALTGGETGKESMYLCFPNRLDDIAVLDVDEWRAQYLLGCLYYDRMNYAAAVRAWERSRALEDGYAFTWRNLASAYFDHMNRPELSRPCLEKALELAPDNARIVYELLQLYKNTNVSVEERLAFLESHRELVEQRDDCYLEWIILLTQAGEYGRARELLLAKRFNIYEGGEGKLTRHHGWQYTLMGRKEHLAGNYAQALHWYKEALVYPANYGEGRHYSAQESGIYYYTGLLYEDMGERENARKAFETAAGQPSQVTEQRYFAALAERKLGRDAAPVLEEMISTAAHIQATAHIPGYFGVGMAAPLPYEQDIVRQNNIEANLLKALGLHGLGREEEARACVEELEKLDPTNFKLSFLRTLGVL